MKLLEDGKLDIMLYDSSDWAGKELRFSWITGGKFYKWFHSVEHHAGFDNWSDAIDWILSVEPDRKINSIQYWGHGSQGKVWMNGKAITFNDFIDSQTKYDKTLINKLKNLKQRLTPESLIWFRCCNVFAGAEGKFFSLTSSQFFNCTVAAHTFIVGPWQSGLHTMKPGKRPDWEKTEGLEVSEDGSVKKLWSTPWAPNTVFCLSNTIPEGW